MSNIAIKVENLSKYYNLGVINSGTLGKDLQSWAWKKMGKEDPNRKIGVHEDNAEGFWALKDLNFEIKKGERVGIIGKNGAGKSTLLKMLSQISAPTEGRIYINGKVASLLEVGTGFNPELTGRENIYMNGAILGMKKREIDAKIDEIIEFSEIERHIDTPVKRYSSGMYVRLAFAVAAHLDSDILIADEVLAVGDVNFQKKALGKMNELSSGQGRTVLFVSHNMSAVKQLCQIGVVLTNGKIVKKGEIGDCIGVYFNRKEGNNSLSWSGNIRNSNICISSVKLININKNNLHTNIITRGDVFFININYEIFTTNEKYVFAIEIFNKREELVCVNSASENMSIETYKEATSIGEHEITIEMDSSIFGIGTYYIRFDIAIANVERFTIDEPELSFVIEDNRQYIKGPYSTSRENMINPVCRWRVS